MTQDTSHPPSGLRYADAGVSIDAGNTLVERIKPHAKRTLRPGVLQGLGGFGALFELPWDRYQQPVLVSGTDGVGTKLKLAQELGRHDTIGIDLVGMCVNDIVVQGAEPLFFLDYFATGCLDVETATSVVKGIADGCLEAGCALVGGETAEMPGMYAAGEYDLAGFAVGLVEKSAIIDGSRVRPGDALLGLASTGPHSNGYSLIRHVLSAHPTDLNSACGDQSLADALMAPTRLYIKPLLALLKQIPVHAVAHITGGGITENLPRVLPQDTVAEVKQNSWQQPEVFAWLQQAGNIATDEMLRTFNCGIGMIIVLPQTELAASQKCLEEHGILSWHIGEIKAHTGAPKVVYSG